MKQCRRPHVLSVIVMLVCFLPDAGITQAAQPKRAPSTKAAKGATTYMNKCTDAKGRVQYTDNPGEDCAETVELSKQGVKIERTEPAGKPGAAVQAAPTSAEAIAVARRDKTLLATYTSESQIEEARARNLEPPVQAVKLGQTHLERARAQLDGLRKQEEQLKQQNKPVPATLNEDLRIKSDQVAHLENELSRKQSRVDEIAARFDADLNRFRELKSSADSR